MTEASEPAFEAGRNQLLREWLTAGGVSLAVAAAVVSPFFFFGMASGHDIAFHMASWLDAASQWKQGILLPRWMEWANFGYGEPRFIFYPPLSWIFGAFLGQIVPWTAVAAVFVVCVQTLAGLSALALLRNLIDSRWAALLGVACFAANPYALVIVYTRSDFAELLAMAFSPLVFLAAFRICGFLEEPGGTSSSWRSIVSFALPFCAVWLSNAPAGVIATYGVTFLFLFASLQRHSLNPLWKGGAGMLLGLAVAAFYLVPAIYEQKWVNISGALAGGLTPSENFLFATTTDAEHDAFNTVASNIAVVLLAWSAIAIVAAFRNSRPGAVARDVLRALTVLNAAILLLMLPVSSLLWTYLPKLRFVQFPWRWMSVLAICAVVLTAAASKGKARWLWLVASASVIVGCGRYLVKHTWWDTEDMPTLELALENREGFEGTDEYDPVGDDHTDLPQKRPRAWFVSGSTHSEESRNEEMFVDQWTAERRVIRVVVRRTEHVAVRLVDYPAWRVSVNGKPEAIQYAAGTRQMIIPVAAGESRIEIIFARTIDRSAGGWISVVAVCGTAGLFAFRRRSARTTRT